MTRTRQIEAYSERQRQADVMRRLELPGDESSPWIVRAVMFIAMALAVAGIFKGAF